MKELLITALVSSITLWVILVRQLIRNEKTIGAPTPPIILMPVIFLTAFLVKIGISITPEEYRPISACILGALIIGINGGLVTYVCFFNGKYVKKQEENPQT